MRMSLGIKISSYIGIAGGILTPALETIRRWHQMSDPQYFINWFDDYLIGAFLLIAAWRTLRSGSEGRPLLIAAWGFATGMCFGSFIFQLQSVTTDPSGISSSTVAIVKAIMLGVCVICMILTLRHSETSVHTEL
jgi:hypothetical protein